MSSNDHLAEIWIEVNGARLSTVRGRDGVDIAIVDYDPTKITPYIVRGRMKRQECGFDTSVAKITVDGHEARRGVCGEGYLFFVNRLNDDYLGFAPLPSVPNGGASDTKLQQLGLISVYIRNAKSVKSTDRNYHTDSLLDGPGLTAPEGKKALFGMQTVSAGKRKSTESCQIIYGNISTTLKIRYASRMALKLKGLLPSENIHRELAVTPRLPPVTVDLSSSSAPPHDLKPDIKPRLKPGVIDVDGDSEYHERGVAKRVPVIDLSGDESNADLGNEARRYPKRIRK